jgi:hypothetical protein
MDSRGVQMKDSPARGSDCVEMNSIETQVGRESVNKKIDKIGRYD